MPDQAQRLRELSNAKHFVNVAQRLPVEVARLRQGALSGSLKAGRSGLLLVWWV